MTIVQKYPAIIGERLVNVLLTFASLQSQLFKNILQIYRRVQTNLNKEN